MALVQQGVGILDGPAHGLCGGGYIGHGVRFFAGSIQTGVQVPDLGIDGAKLALNGGQIILSLLRGEIPVVGLVVGELGIVVVAAVGGDFLPQGDEGQERLLHGGNVGGVVCFLRVGLGGLVVLDIVVGDQVRFLLEKVQKGLVIECFSVVGREIVRTEVVVPFQFGPVGGLGQGPVQGLQARIRRGGVAAAVGIFVGPVAVPQVGAVVNIGQIIVGVEPVVGIIIVQNAPEDRLQVLAVGGGVAGGVQSVL